jgi:flagellar M-ring protein FliF
MSEISSFLKALSFGKKAFLFFGIALLVVMFAVLSWWALKTPKAVLFSDLDSKDAAVIAAELDKLKHGYDLSDDGRAILVAENTVHKTRMNLMARQLPLNGAVGFELFNSAEFGVSDFVQKVNFQRALQGELTRTILAIEQIQSARVHLALPDQALFRKDSQRGKASVTVAMRPGQVLQPAQVTGIQRLVAASVPDVKSDDVAVLDQRGVVLSRAMPDEAGVTGQVDTRQALEHHLTRKATQLVERMFKPGDALVTVDVTLGHQQTKVTTEEVLPGAPVQRNQQPAGVVVRERTVTRESPQTNVALDSGPAATISQETDYQTGKRTEQVVSQAGNIARINVALVVRPALTEADVARIKNVVGASVGMQPNRGDVIAVYSMAQDGMPREVDASNVPKAAAARAEHFPSSPTANSADKSKAQAGATSQIVWALAALLMLACAGAWIWLQSQRQRATVATDSLRALSESERAALLHSVKSWLNTQGSRV